MERYRIDVKGAMQGKRLDLAIVAAKLGLSRRKVRRIIDLGGAYLNKKRVRVASRQVEFGDVIELEYHPEVDRKLKKPNLSLDAGHIIFRDQGILAVNKPAGLPSQATRTQSVFHVAALLKKFLEEQQDPQNIWHLTHRLDKETTGVLILAATQNALKWMTEQFRQRLVEKEYHALVYGHPREDDFTVSCRLSAIQPETGVVRVLKKGGGKESLTHFKVMERLSNQLSLISCRPITGRSHQLRVHLANRGLPIVGDKVYGGRQSTPLLPELQELTSEHHMLHCKSMSFQPGPNTKKLCIEASYPKNFEALLSLLREDV